MNDNPRYQDMEAWEPEGQAYQCRCGCGENLIWKGIGRKPKYLNETHRKREQRRKMQRVTS